MLEVPTSQRRLGRSGRDEVEPATTHGATPRAARPEHSALTAGPPLKILLVTWYFPPTNTMGALRVGKFASYLHDQLHHQFPQLTATRANPLSNTVYFRHPGEAVVKKYSLATMHLEHNGRSEEFAHVVVMPHVTESVLTEFLSDLKT